MWRRSSTIRKRGEIIIFKRIYIYKQKKNLLWTNKTICDEGLSEIITMSCGWIESTAVLIASENQQFAYSTRFPAPILNGDKILVSFVIIDDQIIIVWLFVG